MKILAITDTHNSPTAIKNIKKAIKEEHIDLILHGGDFTVFGDTTKENLQLFEQLKKPVLLIHGNHEDEEEVRNICAQLNNVTFIHEQIWEQGKIKIIGYGGEGFRKKQPEFEAFIKKHKKQIKKGDFIIFLLHQPPFGTVLDELYDGVHVGSQSFMRAIEELQPQLVFAGHIHECFGHHEERGKTLFINPGPYGAVIDLGITTTKTTTTTKSQKEETQEKEETKKANA
ncbi:hypothetical protein D6774_02320 [Candidatus Woesearchaeota archaeon]|jgi:putative phosphoesterase|nr:MAG: hypothetical protein D6774_02320 [Candidatus Woesearchaeota archaeon]